MKTAQEILFENCDSARHYNEHVLEAIFKAMQSYHDQFTGEQLYREVPMVEANKKGGCFPATFHFYEDKEVWLEPLAGERHKEGADRCPEINHDPVVVNEIEPDFDAMRVQQAKYDCTCKTMDEIAGCNKSCSTNGTW